MSNITESYDIPAVLRAIRARLDLTQEQLAERLGVSFASINRWEGGTNMPQKAAQEAIAALAAEAGVAAEPTEAARTGDATPLLPRPYPLDQAHGADAVGRGLLYSR